MPKMTPEQLRQAGLAALRRELGVAGMVQFMQQFDLGHGNYARERWNWLVRDSDVDSLADAIDRETEKGE